MEETINPIPLVEVKVPDEIFNNFIKVIKDNNLLLAKEIAAKQGEIMKFELKELFQKTPGLHKISWQQYMEDGIALFGHAAVDINEIDGLDLASKEVPTEAEQKALKIQKEIADVLSQHGNDQIEMMFGMDVQISVELSIDSTLSVKINKLV